MVVIPGFLGTDVYLMELHAWLGRIGYRPYFSGIGINGESPNLLIERRLNDTIERAWPRPGGRSTWSGIAWEESWHGPSLAKGHWMSLP